jgi:hypothetical protein
MKLDWPVLMHTGQAAKPLQETVTPVGLIRNAELRNIFPEYQVRSYLKKVFSPNPPKADKSMC